MDHFQAAVPSFLSYYNKLHFSKPNAYSDGQWVNSGLMSHQQLGHMDTGSQINP